jgi:signal transduction histidine kinase
MQAKMFSLCCLMWGAPLCAEVPWHWFNSSLHTVNTRRLELERERDQLPVFPRLQIHERAGFHSGFAPSEDSLRWVQVDLGAEFDLDAVVLVPAVLGGADAYGFPKGFRVDVSTDPLFAASVALYEHVAPQEVSVPAPWSVPGRGVRARYVRISATRLVSQPGHSKRFFFCLGELLVFSGGRNVALHCGVDAPKSVETLPTWSPRHLVDGTHPLGLPLVAASALSNGWHSQISPSADNAKWVEIHLSAALPIDEIRMVPAHPADYPDRAGFGFPRRFTVEADSALVMDHTAADFPAPGDTPVAFPTPGLRARTIRITATRLFERSSDFVFALGELQVFSGGVQVALGAEVRAGDSTLTLYWKPEYLVDGKTSAGQLIAEQQWLLQLSERRNRELEWNALIAQQSAEESLAQERAVRMAVVLTPGVLVLAGLLGWRLRRARRLEIEVLRQRISRDLHDEIGSHLGSIRLMTELALREHGRESESLREINRLAGEAAESMRGIIWLVREGDVPPLSSLVEAIRQSAAALMKGVPWTLDASGWDEGVHAPLAFHRNVFLFFREAAHNIARHAMARQVHIQIQRQQNHFVLSLSDDGCGFDLEAVRAGHGLANLRHRAGLLSGQMRIETSPGQGTQVTLEVPWE